MRKRKREEQKINEDTKKMAQHTQQSFLNSNRNGKGKRERE